VPLPLEDLTALSLMINIQSPNYIDRLVEVSLTEVQFHSCMRVGIESNHYTNLSFKFIILLGTVWVTDNKGGNAGAQSVFVSVATKSLHSYRPRYASERVSGKYLRSWLRGKSVLCLSFGKSNSKADQFRKRHPHTSDV